MTDNESMLDQSVEAKTAGISRRTIVKGAAWSVPVVAAMSMAPMAAASGPADATVASANTSQLTGSTSDGTFSGALAGSLLLLNVSGNWETGELGADARVYPGGGKTISFDNALWTNGTLAGSPISVGTFLNTINGIPWTIVVSAVAGGGYRLISTAPSQKAVASYDIPGFSFAGSVSPLPVVDNSLNTSVRVKAANVSAGSYTVATTQAWLDPTPDDED